MKLFSRLSIIILLLSSGLFYSVFAFSIPPKPAGYVNDYANVLTADQKQTLETNLSTYDKETTNELVLVIIPSLDGDTVENVGIKLFETWKVGKKAKDNGIIFLVAMQDRKMRFEVGYGLEPYITDGIAGEILRTSVAPEFQKGDTYAGITKGIETLQTTIAKRASGDMTFHASSSATTKSKTPSIPFYIIIMVFIYLSSFMARTKDVVLGGIAGAILGIIIGIASGIGMAVILAIIFGIVGLILDAILSSNYKAQSSRGGPTDFFHTGGGFFGGGGGSSRGGGGFGGFGGGRSGGGGASSSW